MDNYCDFSLPVSFPSTVCWLCVIAECRLNHRQMMLREEASDVDEESLLAEDLIPLEQLEIRRYAPTLSNNNNKNLHNNDLRAQPVRPLQYTEEALQLDASSPPALAAMSSSSAINANDSLASQLSAAIRLPTRSVVNRTFVSTLTGPRFNEKPKGKLLFRQRVREQLGHFDYEVIEQRFGVSADKWERLKTHMAPKTKANGTNMLTILPGRNSPQALVMKKWGSRGRRHSTETSFSTRTSSKLLELLNFVRENKIDKNLFASFNQSNQTLTGTEDVLLDTLSEPLLKAEESIQINRKQPIDLDSIILIGAHYDTVEDCNGINDNGSGSILLLELAKALSSLRYKLKHTIIFVWFDLEEQVSLI